MKEAYDVSLDTPLNDVHEPELAALSTVTAVP